MAAPGAVTHEWVINNISFRLAYGLVGVQQAHTVTPIPFLAQQISSTAELTYTDINREVEVAFAQAEYSQGLSARTRFSLDTQKQFRWAKNIDTSFPDYVLPAPKVTTAGATIATKPTIAIQRVNVTYIAAGAALYQMTNSSTVTLDTTFGASITALYVWGGYLIVGLGSTTNFQYRASDAGAFVAAGFPAHFLVGNNDVLWRAITPNLVFNADAITGPWAQYDVGDTSYNITSIGILDQVILIGKQDGMYAFDNDLQSLPITPELKLQASSQVCSVSQIHNREYYFTSRIGMVKLKPGEGFASIGLDTFADPALPGGSTVISGMATDGRFLYAIVNSGNGIYIWKRDFSGAWHNYLWRSDLGAGAPMLLATGQLGSTAVNAILFAYQSGVNWQMAYANFATTIDPIRDPNYLFDTTTTGYLRTLDYVASYPTIQKYSDRLKCISDAAGATKLVSFYSYVDGGAQTKVIDFQQVPSEETTLVSPLQYYRISLEIAMIGAQAPQLLRAFQLSAAYLTRVVRKHTCYFLSVGNTPMATGGRERNDYHDTINSLRDLRKNLTAVACRDEDLNIFNAYIEDITEATMEQKQGDGLAPTKVVTVVLKEVST